MALKENYKDDILDVSQNVKRKYQMENNGDGTVSFTDVTEYTQQGDSFGSGAINPIAHAINGLNNYNFHPSGSIDLVAYIADDTYYLNNDSKYVLADSPTGQALITSDPTTYKALASNTDLYGIEGADTASGFEPSSTPITVGGETLVTIDDKLNYLISKDTIFNELIQCYPYSGQTQHFLIQSWSRDGSGIGIEDDTQSQTTIDNNINSRLSHLSFIKEANYNYKGWIKATTSGKFYVVDLYNSYVGVVSANANDTLVYVDGSHAFTTEKKFVFVCYLGA